eukprot:Pgem_evm1s5731
MIYTTFIVARSPKEINLKESTRNAIVQIINSEAIEAQMFNSAQQEVFTLMKKDSFKRFKTAISENGSLRERNSSIGSNSLIMTSLSNISNLVIDSKTSLSSNDSQGNTPSMNSQTFEGIYAGEDIVNIKSNINNELEKPCELPHRNSSPIIVDCTLYTQVDDDSDDKNSINSNTVDSVGSNISTEEEK